MSLSCTVSEMSPLGYEIGVYQEWPSAVLPVEYDYSSRMTSDRSY